MPCTGATATGAGLFFTSYTQIALSHYLYLSMAKRVIIYMQLIIPMKVYESPVNGNMDRKIKY